MRRDYYAVLGIAASAGPREIRQAFRRLARQYSPDVNFWDERARTLFDEIAEAYRILSDPGARELYDRLGMAGAEALAPGRSGDDVHLAVEVSFGDAARGADLALSVTRHSPCAHCGATGRADDGPCAVCQGRGVHRASERVAVRIPPGVDSGSQIRISGEGHAGPFGAPRGDLVVSTRVADHPFFTRKGDNVHCELAISVWEALRGARVRIPTPASEAVVVVPTCTAPGQTCRLRGQGLPRRAGEGRGDLYVTLRVVMPSALDARTDELVRELERLAPVAPRANPEGHEGGGA